MNSGWARSYQVCQRPSCGNWIWNDRIRAGFVCRKCGEKWQKLQRDQLFEISQENQEAAAASTTSSRPGFTRRKGLQDSKIQKATAETLAPAWSSLEAALQVKPKDLGISPPPPTPEPDLKDVLETCPSYLQRCGN